jgi:hypothetical protein
MRYAAILIVILMVRLQWNWQKQRRKRRENVRGFEVKIAGEPPATAKKENDHG